MVSPLDAPFLGRPLDLQYASHHGRGVALRMKRMIRTSVTVRQVTGRLWSEPVSKI